MPQKIKTYPFGGWLSPLSAAQVAGASPKYGDIRLDDQYLYWVESLPEQGGRQAIFRADFSGNVRQLLPSPFDARSRVHEYGGGVFAVGGRELFFSNRSDDGIYRLTGDSDPVLLTRRENFRYADLQFDQHRHSLIAVREDHSAPGREAQNCIVAIPLHNPAAEQVLLSGNDFYASPSFNPAGSRLCWLAWDHPDMPWDQCRLWIAETDAAGAVRNPQPVAGGSQESIFQPQWSADGDLYFVSDRSGWWNLYRLVSGKIEALCEMPAEFGLPQWVFGMSTYAFIGKDQLACTFSEDGKWHLALLDVKSKSLRRIPTSFTDITQLRSSPQAVGGDKPVAFWAGSPTQPTGLYLFRRHWKEPQPLRAAGKLPISGDCISVPRRFDFPTNGGVQCHGFYYPPVNPGFRAPERELPPLLVMSHGGPTAAVELSVRLKTQYWTSRGFSVLLVNYRGSTGYGRGYRELLNGNWGKSDVEDCVNAARHAAHQRLADPQRLLISGSSAGGLTVLSALTFFEVFRAGGCYYGISDLEALALETHKFESRDTERLIAPYPREREIYRSRSPIHHAERMKGAVIFFQGKDDPVVPLSQAQQMVEVLKRRGVTVAFLEFEGEGHGFRRKESLIAALEAEYAFYCRVLKIPALQALPKLSVENLQS